MINEGRTKERPPHLHRSRSLFRASRDGFQAQGTQVQRQSASKALWGGKARDDADTTAPEAEGLDVLPRM